jgi:hypothetical protein
MKEDIQKKDLEKQRRRLQQVNFWEYRKEWRRVIIPNGKAANL